MYIWFDSYAARVVTEERLRDRTKERFQLVPSKAPNRVRPFMRSLLSVLL